MNITGIVAEYNPFHNGHYYHIQKAKETSSCDYIIVVMSGNFVQRGEPSIFDKFIRAKMALASGADMVIELPFVYSTASAEAFSFGAISLLEQSGIVSNVCFGSECGSIESLSKIAQIFSSEPDEYRSLLKKALDTGVSFPSAREIATIQYVTNFLSTQSADSVSSIIKTPNNILGIEYLKALYLLKSTIKPITIKRIANDYNSVSLTGSISSATSIRDALKHSHLTFGDTVSLTIPESSRESLQNSDIYSDLIFWDNFQDMLFYKIRSSSASLLSTYRYVTEGLENKILHAAGTSASVSDLISSIKSKRYTRTRIQRALTSILLQCSNEFSDSTLISKGPQYLRVLGVSKNGKALLSLLKNNAGLPVLVRPADFEKLCSEFSKKMLSFDINASNIYALGHTLPKYRNSNSDYKNLFMKV